MAYYRNATNGGKTMLIQMLKARLPFKKALVVN